VILAYFGQNLIALATSLRTLESQITSLPTNYLILTSVPTVNIIPLKQSLYTFTIISSMQQDHKSYHVYVSSTFLLPLAPSTTASYSLISPLGSVSMALSSTGLSPTCHIAPSVSDVITLFRPCVPPPVVFPRLRSWFPCFSSCTLPLSALSSPFHWITTFMQMTPNCYFSHFTHPTSIHALLTFRMPFSKSLPGWLPIS